MKLLYFWGAVIVVVVILILFFQNLSTAVDVAFFMGTTPFLAFFMSLLVLGFIFGGLVTLYFMALSTELKNQGDSNLSL